MKGRIFPLILLVAFIIASCTDSTYDDTGRNIKSNKVVLTPEEYTSIAYDNPRELSEKEIIDIVYDFQHINSEFKNEAVTRSAGISRVSIINKYYLISHEDTIRHSTSRSLNVAAINAPIFEIELSKSDNKKDFAVICGDERDAKVLFYANDYNSSDEINIEMRYLIEVAKQSALSDIELIEKIKIEKRNSTLDKVSKELDIPKEQITDNVIKEQIITTDNIETKGEYNPINGIVQPTRIISMVVPMSNVAWHQEHPYNLQMPIDSVWSAAGAYTGNIPIGCANVAVATLFTILRPAMVGVTSTGRQILIDWDYVTSIRSLYVSDYQPSLSSPPRIVEMVGSLLRAVYNETKSKPHYEERETYDVDQNKIKINVVVETSTVPADMLNYIQTMATYSGNTKFDPNFAKQSLLDHKPVLLYGNGHFIDNNRNPIQEEPYKDQKPGHAWLIDGYCMTKKSGQAINDQYWSVNMGWGTGSSNVYFKTQSNFQDCDVVFSHGYQVNIVYYTQEQNMIYNIVKK